MCGACGCNILLGRRPHPSLDSREVASLLLARSPAGQRASEIKHIPSLRPSSNSSLPSMDSPSKEPGDHQTTSSSPYTDPSCKLQPATLFVA